MRVKLSVYSHTPTETVIESFQAKEWDDFVVIRVSGGSQDFFQQLSEALSRKYKDSNKQVILVSADADIEFYGIKEAD